MNELTEAEVVRVLAEREGLPIDVCMCGDTERGSAHRAPFGDHGFSPMAETPPYLTSRDALVPVLEKLTDREWDTLWSLLSIRYNHSNISPSWTQWLLTFPPRNLASAIAEAIEKGQP